MGEGTKVLASSDEIMHVRVFTNPTLSGFFISFTYFFPEILRQNY